MYQVIISSFKNGNARFPIKTLFTYLCFLGFSVFSNGQNACVPLGWATESGGVSGGGDATPLIVKNYEKLNNAIYDESVKVIYIEGPITIPSGGRMVLHDQSGKSILGLPGAELISKNQTKLGSGIIQIKRCNNIIIRNIKFEGPGAYDVDGRDLMTIENSRNIWIDHCSFEDGCDDNLDIKSASDLITITWCIFRYLKPPKAGGPGGSDDHRFSNLIGSSNDAMTDQSKLRVTFQYCWWGEGVVARMPRVRFGQVHIANNLFSSTATDYCIRAGLKANLLVQGNVFIDQPNPIDLYNNSYTAIHASNNLGALDITKGIVFIPPYTLEVIKPSLVQTIVEACAGPALIDPNDCPNCDNSK